jgi:hypothetical protein
LTHGNRRMFDSRRVKLDRSGEREIERIIDVIPCVGVNGDAGGDDLNYV